MDAPIRSVETPSGLPKARRSSRSPVLFASIELGKTFRGFILNASEGGLCVQAAREIVLDEPLELRFQSVQPGAWVEARGRIAWRNETRTVAGIEFVDLTPEIVQEIRKWLFFGASLQELRGNWEAEQSAMEPAVADCNLSDDSGFQEHAAIPRSRPVEIGKRDVTSSCTATTVPREQSRSLSAPFASGGGIRLGASSSGDDRPEKRKRTSRISAAEEFPSVCVQAEHRSILPSTHRPLCHRPVPAPSQERPTK